MNKAKKNKVGRPALYNWNKANFLWKEKTDSEIATVVGCTSMNVRTRRQRLVLKNAEHYTCTRAKWDRGGRKNKARA